MREFRQCVRRVLHRWGVDVQTMHRELARRSPGPSVPGGIDGRRRKIIAAVGGFTMTTPENLAGVDRRGPVRVARRNMPGRSSNAVYGGVAA